MVLPRVRVQPTQDTQDTVRKKLRYLLNMTGFFLDTTVRITYKKGTRVRMYVDGTVRRGTYLCMLQECLKKILCT